MAGQIYHDDMITHLREQVIELDDRINAVRRLQQHGDMLTEVGKTKILDQVLTHTVHPWNCMICEAYSGEEDPLAEKNL